MAKVRIRTTCDDGENKQIINNYSFIIMKE